MEAFYEGEKKGEYDRKEKGKEVKPRGRVLFSVLTLVYCMDVLFEEIIYYVLPKQLEVLRVCVYVVDLVRKMNFITIKK